MWKLFRLVILSEVEEPPPLCLSPERSRGEAEGIPSNADASAQCPASRTLSASLSPLPEVSSSLQRIQPGLQRPPILFVDIQKPQPHHERVAPNHIRFRTKSPWLNAGKLKLHRNHALDPHRINQFDRQPAFANVLHLGGKRLPNRSLKPHRQIHVVSKISPMFALHLRNGRI